MTKLSVNETKLSILLARTHPLILFISIWIFDFGPVKLPGLSRNGPLASNIHTSFQTWRLWNYFIITLIRTRTKKISLSFYLIWNWNNEYVRTLLRVSSRTVPDSRPKWAKSLPVFRPKRSKNHTLWDGTYIYGLYMGVPPPGFSLFPKKNQSVRFILTGV